MSKITIRNREVVQAYQAISTIGVLTPKSSKATYALARNKSRLKSLVEARDSVLESIRKECFKEESNPDKDHPNAAKFSRMLEDLDKMEVEYEPYQFPEAELKLDAEALSPSQLEAIFLLMETPPEPLIGTPKSNGETKPKEEAKPAEPA